MLQRDQMAGATLWYPGTPFIKDVPGFVSRPNVPALMFAKEQDA
jgi:hypothetical protein